MKQNPAQPENRLHFWVRMVQSYTVGLSPGDVMEAASWCLKTENDGDALVDALKASLQVVRLHGGSSINAQVSAALAKANAPEPDPHYCRCCGELCESGVDCCTDEFAEPGELREWE